MAALNAAHRSPAVARGAQFSRVIVFGAHHWADEATAAAEISEAFRLEPTLPSLAQQHKLELEEAITPSFTKGDVLLAIQCTQLAMLPSDEKLLCMARVAKLVDCVSIAWTQLDERGCEDLGAVVVVLEGFADPSLTADWSGGDTMTYPVTPLDDELSAFFKE